MKYKTNSDLVDAVYNQFKEELEVDGQTISTNTEDVDLDAIVHSYLITKYSEQTEDLEKIQSIAKAIESGLDLPPILVDRNNNVIDGFHRLMACQMLKLESIVCLRYSDELVHLEMK